MGHSYASSNNQIVPQNAQRTALFARKYVTRDVAIFYCMIV